MAAAATHLFRARYHLRHPCHRRLGLLLHRLSLGDDLAGRQLVGIHLPGIGDSGASSLLEQRGALCLLSLEVEGVRLRRGGVSRQ